jgi:hypothetical protein
MTRRSAPAGGASSKPHHDDRLSGNGTSVLRPAAGRTTYNDAGRAYRSTVHRAMAVGLTPLELRVLLVVLELTASYSKMIDSTSARQIAARVYDTTPELLKGSQRQRVQEALRSLETKSIIGYETSRGRYSVPNVWIHWRLVNVTPPDDVDEYGFNDTQWDDVGAPDAVQCHPAAASMSPAGGVNVTPARDNTEKYYREELPRADRATARCAS